jgi:hypothetical protein
VKTLENWEDLRPAVPAADLTFLRFVPAREAAWRRGVGDVPDGDDREDLRDGDGGAPPADTPTPGWLWDADVVGYFDGAAVRRYVRREPVTGGV